MEINSSHMSELEEYLAAEKNPFPIIHLGDILQPECLENSSKELDLFHNLVKDKKNGRIVDTSDPLGHF